MEFDSDVYRLTRGLKDSVPKYSQYYRYLGRSILGVRQETGMSVRVFVNVIEVLPHGSQKPSGQMRRMIQLKG